MPVINAYRFCGIASPVCRSSLVGIAHRLHEVIADRSVSGWDDEQAVVKAVVGRRPYAKACSVRC